ncbi:hypothetical protein [Pseudanabaena sp. 'Roaring Creek']|uniref:hypothetical protein n=1 Tax=Pseudanabaena sp. 'Roaring Creek' TaxID=1681830 RepID=UPI0006D819BB|nr:hypothetical protein [Pseudanabaena sp. 'Roaring Creek']
MKEVRITDLDELALKVRDQISRSYILEAIDAYRGGAYRSSIISVWIAVNFDIISKIRELANRGDKMAHDFVNTLDKAIEKRDIKELQRIEENLLHKAEIDYEFVNNQEKYDLEQLKNDRNLCAHPAFIAEDKLFEPEPERVRMHIVHAIKYLLQHPPIQGKSAIERIVRDIKSIGFPDTLEEASIFLNARYLDSSKKVLVKNIVVLLLKAILHGNLTDLPLSNYSRRIFLTLQSVSKRHPNIYEETIQSNLLKMIEALDDECLPNICQLIASDPRCWNWLDEATKSQLKAYIKLSPNQTNIHTSIFMMIVISDLKSIIIEIFNKLPTLKQVTIIKLIPQPEFAEQAIKLYSGASSYRGAESLGESLILPMVGCFCLTDIQKILKVVQENDQIYDAGGTPKIMLEMYEKTNQYLSSLKENWKELFKVLWDKKYSYWYEQDPKLDVWDDSGWASLANHLKSVGIKLPPE